MAFTNDHQNPDAVIQCECCKKKHEHAGQGCRPLTITVVPGTAQLKAGA